MAVGSGESQPAAGGASGAAHVQFINPLAQFDGARIVDRPRQQHIIYICRHATSSTTHSPPPHPRPKMHRDVEADGRWIPIRRHRRPSPSPSFSHLHSLDIPNTRRSACMAMTMLPLHSFLHRASVPAVRCHDRTHVSRPSRSGVTIPRGLYRQTPPALPALPAQPVSRLPEIFVPCPCSWSRRLALITGGKSRRGDPPCREGSEKEIRLSLRKCLFHFNSGAALLELSTILSHSRVRRIAAPLPEDRAFSRGPHP